MAEVAVVLLLLYTHYGQILDRWHVQITNYDWDFEPGAGTVLTRASSK